MMTAKEVVRRAVTFQGPDRLPRNFPPRYGSDFAGLGMSPSPDARPGNGVDEWGAVWENIGVCKLGEVKDYPLKDWRDFGGLKIPDASAAFRWQTAPRQAAEAGDNFLMAYGVSLYERVHFLRGLENTWTDIYLEPDNLRGLIGVLVDMNLQAIPKFAALGADGYMFCDDWGLQNKLMISPESWREFWKPAYAQVYQAARAAGMLTFLHSCGHIVSILDDLIEIGLDVIQMDQQENMGLDLLSERFRGRIAFWCPVDIQAAMRRPLDQVRKSCHDLYDKLGSVQGGFLPQWYGDPVGAGHSPEAIDAMCQEFLKISREVYGN